MAKGQSYPCVELIFVEDPNLPFKMLSHHTKIKLCYCYYTLSRGHTVGAIFGSNNTLVLVWCVFTLPPRGRSATITLIGS